MGAIRSTVLRAAIYSLAVAISLVSGLIIVRRLDVGVYAIYQSTVKRFTSYITASMMIFGFWAYRYMAEGVEGSASTYLLLSCGYATIGFMVGFLASYLMGASLLYSVLAGITVSMVTIFNSVKSVLNVVRPVRFSLLVLAKRILYCVLVILLVYMMELRGLGAFAAAILSPLIAIVLGLSWARHVISRPRLSLVAEWARGAYVPAISAVTLILYGLDIIIAYYFGGAALVAGFFAIMLVFGAIMEPLHTSLTHLQAYLLSGGEVERVFDSGRAVALLAIPVIVYLAVHARHLVYLLNPAYAWAAIAAPLAALATILVLVQTCIGQAVSGLIRGGVRVSSRRLLPLAVIGLVGGLTYIGSMMVLEPLTQSIIWLSLIIWLVCRCLGALVRIVLLIRVAEPNVVRMLVKRLITPLSFYTVIALILSMVLHPLAPPSRSFWHTLSTLAPSFIAYMLVYTICILALDPWSRLLARRSIKLAKSIVAKEA